MRPPYARIFCLTRDFTQRLDGREHGTISAKESLGLRLRQEFEYENRETLSATMCNLSDAVVPFAQARPIPPREANSSTSLQSNILPGQNFDGIGQNSFGYTDPSISPDPAGAVGATQYVEWVNTSLAVFNKATGAIVYGPVLGSQIWSSMGGPCANYNDGQPVVQFDKLAMRWVLGQLVLHGPPYYFCVAVSTSGDATGPYNLYSLSLGDMPDSPRLSTWQDAYYTTFNMFSGRAFLYSNVCALDRITLSVGRFARNVLLSANVGAVQQPLAG